MPMNLNGIDIISLSWGITSHEGGGPTVKTCTAASWTKPWRRVSWSVSRPGTMGPTTTVMGSSSLSITVGATDDKDTIDREDDTVAGYSSRGPRRDNGDSNPLNELKPEVTAPGTNIVQAEGCVTSAGCHNDVPGQDAADNDTNRGSGTSYATPAVSGIIALMMEANPDLSPLRSKRSSSSRPNVVVSLLHRRLTPTGTATLAGAWSMPEPRWRCPSCCLNKAPRVPLTSPHRRTWTTSPKPRPW